MKRSKIILDVLYLKSQLGIQIDVSGRKLEAREHLGSGTKTVELPTYKDIGLDEVAWEGSIIK